MGKQKKIELNFSTISQPFSFVSKMLYYVKNAELGGMC